MVNISKVESLIKGKGWSNSYFCSLFDKNVGWIRGWKRSRGLPDTNTLEQIANKLDTTVEYLTDQTDIKNKPLVNGDEGLTEYLEELRTRPEMRMLFQLTSTATKAIDSAADLINSVEKKEQPTDCRKVACGHFFIHHFIHHCGKKSPRPAAASRGL